MQIHVFLINSINLSLHCLYHLLIQSLNHFSMAGQVLSKAGMVKDIASSSYHCETIVMIEYSIFIIIFIVPQCSYYSLISIPCL